MDYFLDFNKQINEQFMKMCSTGKLYRTDLNNDEAWDLYLASFEHDATWRVENEHNCNCCKGFMRRYGNVVAIIDGRVESMFSRVTDADEYQAPAKAINELIISKPIVSFFYESSAELEMLGYDKKVRKTNTPLHLGYPTNYKIYTEEDAEGKEVGKTYQFDHFRVDYPREMLGTNAMISLGNDVKDNIIKIVNDFSDLTVLDSMAEMSVQNSLLDAQEVVRTVQSVKTLLTNASKAENLELYAWTNADHNNIFLKTFRNSLIGQLYKDIVEKSLSDACIIWNKRKDPTNYMKAVKPISAMKKKITEKFVVENDYVASLSGRRLATIDDIKASQIKHVSEGKKVVSLFDSLVVAKAPVKGEDATSISIEKFLSDVLPMTGDLRAMFENKHANNLVALTTAVDPDAKNMFKWNNPFSWTFKNNLAGKSQITEAVKAFGGFVEAPFRCSIAWAFNDGDHSDLDLHCTETINGDKNEIYFANRHSHLSIGRLDVDIQSPKQGVDVGAIENIFYNGKVKDGIYAFSVQQFLDYNSKGFKAELLINGDRHSYVYSNRVAGRIPIATVTVKGGVFTIEHHLPSTSVSTKAWGLNTEEYHQVELVSTTPNHWDGEVIGNNHYLFMLKGCEVEGGLRGYHSENLNDELHAHRQVLDVLGYSIDAQHTENHLAGLGFNETVKDELLVTADGRPYKIMF